MGLAARLAERGLGRCAPNPSVGCVLVGWPAGSGQGARVLGRGRTQPGGRPHAETESISHARAAYGRPAVAGATAYVSLEPCGHQGKTPPCTQALIEAGIRRVVVAEADADPRVAGAGMAQLGAAGIAVDVVANEHAAEVNLGHRLRHTRGRPMVTCKTAVSLDGRIAVANGGARWITGPRARAYGHVLRARHDAIMVGVETVVRDDPRLDSRVPGLGAASPIRVVLDSTLRMPPTCRLASDGAMTWVVHGRDAAVERRTALAAQGVELIVAELGDDGRIDLQAALKALAARGLTRVLVEGGGALTASFLRAGLADRVALFQAPTLIGGDGTGCVEALGVSTPDEAVRLTPLVTRRLGADQYVLLAVDGKADV